MPQTYAEKQAFKAAIAAHKVKMDEENFEEAEAQAFRLWSEKPVCSAFLLEHNLRKIHSYSHVSARSLRMLQRSSISHH